MKLDEALRRALLACVSGEAGRAGHYAAAYIEAIPLAVQEYPEKGLTCQLNYILANLESWCGPVARECKEVMRREAKVR